VTCEVPWMALRRSRVRSWPRPVRWRQISAMPAAPAMIGMPMHGREDRILARITAQTPYGELVRLAPPVKFSETRPYWQDPVLVVRGSSKAQWKDS
jgi:hypothetical protein